MKNNSLTEIFIFETMQMAEQIENMLMSAKDLTKENIDEIFRLIHTIKGSASMISHDKIVQIAHEAEELVYLLHNVAGEKIAEVSDMLLKSNDYIKSEILSMDPNDYYTGSQDCFSKSTSFNVIDNLSDDNYKVSSTGTSGSPIYYTAKIMFQKNSQMENVRAFQVTNNLKNYVDNITTEPNDLSCPESAEIIALSGVTFHFTSSTPQNELKRIIEKTMLVKSVEFQNESTVSDVLVAVNASEIEKIAMLTEQILETGDMNIANQIQETVKNIRFTTMSDIFRKMELTVKSICTKCYKNVTMDFTGENLTISKVIATGIAPALLHIARNAVDHGILDEGHIKVNASKENNQYIFSVSDDGRGIDKEKITYKAMRSKVIKDENISDAQVLNLLISPGFTSCEDANEISGRGMGMDIAYKCIEKLNGTFNIKSAKNLGTTITISVPEHSAYRTETVLDSHRIASFVIDAIEV